MSTSPESSLAGRIVTELLPLVARELQGVRGLALHSIIPASQLLILRGLVRVMATQRGLTLPRFLLPSPSTRRADVFVRDFVASLSPLVLHPRLLGAFHEVSLGVECGPDFMLISNPARRRASGSFYTPESVIDDVLHHAVAPILASRTHHTPRILDPAMGTGHFLLRALDLFTPHACASPPSPAQRARFALTSLVGVEIDPLVVRLARISLWLHVADPATPLRAFHATLIHANSLLPTRRPVLCQPFDAVVGNPPFVGSESLVRTDPAFRKFAARSFKVARGNWDLSALFVEHALGRCAPGGIMSMVLPARLLASDHAAALQELLLAHRVIVMRDYSGSPVFTTTQVPVVVVAVRNLPSTPAHRVRCEQAGDTSYRREPTIAELRTLPRGHIGLPLRATPPAIVLALQSPHTFANLASFSDGATTAEAYALREAIRESTKASQNGVRLVNTGTIDPFRLLWGERATRYLGRTLQRPVIDERTLARIAPRRLAQALLNKVIIAGMGSRLEAAFAPARVLCGKSAVLAVPRPGICPHALAALLNATLVSEVYRALFGLRGFSPRSMTIGPRQVERLPAPHPRHLAPGTPLSILARAHEPAHSTIALDRLVERLYSVESDSQPPADPTSVIPTRPCRRRAIRSG